MHFVNATKMLFFFVFQVERCSCWLEWHRAYSLSSQAADVMSFRIFFLAYKWMALFVIVQVQQDYKVPYMFSATERKNKNISTEEYIKKVAQEGKKETNKYINKPGF